MTGSSSRSERAYPSRAGWPVPGGPPVVAIVGRPNVGKSTLFNRIVGKRRAIVDDVPGVTRDRLVALARHGEREFLCVDTGGFASGRVRGGLEVQVMEHTREAVAGADCVIALLDGQAGLLPGDRELIEWLRRSGRTVIFAVNKIDSERHESAVCDFACCGVVEPVALSAAHGRGVAALLDAVVAELPPAAAAPAAAQRGTRVAIVGRPNVGKSSLLNRLVGYERTIVTAEPGTTRDAIDTPVNWEGKSFVLVDTAGIRRRSRSVGLERHGAVRALGAIARADLVCLVIDGTEGPTEQDARIARVAWDAGRAVLLVVNKWDAVSPERRAPRAFSAHLEARFPSLAALPRLFVSALTGWRIERLFPALASLDEAHARSLPTPELNRVVGAAVREHPPPATAARACKVRYATQVGKRPPRLVIFLSGKGTVPAAYERYLENRLRSAFALAGVPLRLEWRRAAPAARRPRGRARRC